MSLPPSALYPATGVAYNEFNTCLYSVAGAVVATTPVNGVLPLDAGTGIQATGLFIQMGRDVGLKPNRHVPTVGTEPVVGALVNTSTVPVAISGSVLIQTSGAYVVGDIDVVFQGVGSATLSPIGGIIGSAINSSLSIPFSCILLTGDSIFVRNGTVIQTANLSASLVACRASNVYGTLNSVQATYIPV